MIIAQANIIKSSSPHHHFSSPTCYHRFIQDHVPITLAITIWQRSSAILGPNETRRITDVDWFVRSVWGKGDEKMRHKKHKSRFQEDI